MKKILLTVAGFDPSGGAGVLLDLQVFRSLGFQGTAVLTALTSQNIQKVLDVIPLPAPFVLSQYRALKRDFAWRGIKVGLVGKKANLSVIKIILEELAHLPRVIDPVFRASSGAWFLDRESIPAFIKAIGGRATVITPNLQEATLLTGIKIRGLEDMEKAAKAVYELTGVACFLKGGHLKGGIFDVLFTGKKSHVIKSQRLPVQVHGTGCFLSASLLAYLARGYKLEDAIQLARRYTRRAIKQAVKLKSRRGRALFSF